MNPLRPGTSPDESKNQIHIAMKLKKVLLPLSTLALAAAAHAQSTAPDATQITSDISTGIDSGMTVATKVVGALVALFIVGMVVRLVKKGKSAA